MGKGAEPGMNGYYYSFGIHMGISRGEIDELVEIKVGDKTAWTGSVTASGSISIDSPDLFGGDKGEGGIVGNLDVMMGESTQVAPAGMVAMLGHALPGFRRMLTVFFDGRISANNPYPKAWKFRVRRTLKGWQDGAPWYPEKCKIVMIGSPVTTQTGGGYGNVTGEPGNWEPIPAGVSTTYPEIHAMNPAHMLYEVITNKEWGRGLPVSALNVASFAACADTLFDEGFGLCFRWTRRSSLESFVQSIIDHIGGAIFSDRETSLLTIKLIRDDYDPATLPIYDADTGLLEINEYVTTSLGPAINEIQVSYVDQIANKSRGVISQNLASLQASQGVFNSLKKTYNGVPTAGLAQRLAQRDLRANAMALRRFKLTFDRRAWRIPPAGVIRIRDLGRGIEDIVLRVGRIEDGTLTNGKIIITAVQDVFGFPLTAFVDEQVPDWKKPDNKAQLKRHRVFEVPYFMLNQNMSPADFAYVAPDAGYLGAVAEKPNGLSLAYTLYVRPSAPTPDDEAPQYDNGE